MMGKRYGYYDDDGDWVSEPYVGFGCNLTEVTEPTEDEEDDWSLTSVRLHLLDVLSPVMIPQGFDPQQIVSYAKTLEDYVYSE